MCYSVLVDGVSIDERGELEAALGVPVSVVADMIPWSGVCLCWVDIHKMAAAAGFDVVDRRGPEWDGCERYELMRRTPQ